MVRPMTIDGWIAEYAATPGGILVDVRLPEEYADGRIPGSINIPMQELDRIFEAVPDFDTPVFVYCTGGVQAAYAAAWFEQEGYTRVEAIGAILDYSGVLER